MGMDDEQGQWDATVGNREEHEREPFLEGSLIGWPLELVWKGLALL